jgi:hypothetical protein
MDLKPSDQIIVNEVQRARAHLRQAVREVERITVMCEGIQGSPDGLTALLLANQHLKQVTERYDAALKHVQESLNVAKSVSESGKHHHQFPWKDVWIDASRKHPQAYDFSWFHDVSHYARRVLCCHGESMKRNTWSASGWITLATEHQFRTPEPLHRSKQAVFASQVDERTIERSGEAVWTESAPYAPWPRAPCEFRKMAHQATCFSPERVLTLESVGTTELPPEQWSQITES